MTALNCELIDTNSLENSEDDEQSLYAETFYYINFEPKVVVPEVDAATIEKRREEMEQLIDDAYSFYNYSFKFWAFIPWFMLFSWTLIDIPLALLSFVYPSLAQLAFLGFLLGWLVGFWP